MKKKVLISGASFAGLTLAYWLNKFGYEVTIIEISKALRRGGSPIDVRGEALDIVNEMGILEKIRAAELDHFNEAVNARNETIVSWNNNKDNVIERPDDIEIHRDDLLDILYENVCNTGVEFLFGNRIGHLVQGGSGVDVTLSNGERRTVDLVFGADGTHSAVRKLVFGEEENYSKFFGAYFAIAEAGKIQTKPNTGVIYNEPGKMAGIYPFKKSSSALLLFRSPRLNYDYRDHAQHKQILEAEFGNTFSWKIPEILDALLHSDNLYFDEVCQIHMPSWTKDHVALVGDAAHAPSFFTGMGTSLALQGATLLAKALHANADHTAAFAIYNESFRPFVTSVQSRIVRGINLLLPETQEGIDEAYKRFRK